MTARRWLVAVVCVGFLGLALDDARAGEQHVRPERDGVTYDPATGKVKACVQLTNYAYSDAFQGSQVALFAVVVAGVRTEFLWAVTDEVMPCLEFSTRAGAHEGDVRLYYYANPEFHAKRADVFAGTRQVNTPALRALAAKIEAAGQPISLSRSGEVQLGVSGTLYLNLNGKVPAPDGVLQAGVSKTPAVFTWFVKRLAKDAVVDYRYRLYPTQPDWTALAPGTSATITYVPAGIHVFEVQARVTVNGISSYLAPAKYQFSIESPFVALYNAATVKAVTGARAPTVEQARDYTRKRALLIGVTGYHSADFQPLHYTANDVDAVKKALLGDGFAADHIEAKVGNFTSDQIRSAIWQFMSKAASDEQTVIYLSGHGFAPKENEDDDMAYFAGTDCTKVNGSCLALPQVKVELASALESASGPRHIVLIVDACFAGRAVVAKGWSSELGTAQRAVHVMAAGTRNQLAIEDDTAKLSYFTEYLAKGLEGGANMIPDGYITLSELGTWVRFQVSNATGQQQTPSFTRIKGAGEMLFKVKP